MTDPRSLRCACGERDNGGPARTSPSRLPGPRPPAELIVLIGWMIAFILAGLVVCVSDAWKAVAP